MPLSRELYLAILAMDAYNREYDQNVSLSGTRIGEATILTRDGLDADLVDFDDWQSSGFYMALMIVGGGPTSTAGGLKVTTVVVMVLATIAFLRRRTEWFGAADQLWLTDRQLRFTARRSYVLEGPALQTVATTRQQVLAVLVEQEQPAAEARDLVQDAHGL